MKSFLPIAFILASIGAFAQDGGADIVLGKSHTIHSKILNEKRHYAVYLPDGYQNKSAHPKSYPVIYLLDGESHFHSVSGIVDVKSPFYLPQMIVVAIGNTDRRRDLTPTHVDSLGGIRVNGMEKTGGGEDFLSFIEQELVPHIQSAYRTAPFSILIGHSLGGLTALYAAYFRPNLFNALIAIDPTVGWDNNMIIKKFEEERMQSKLINKSIFLGISNRTNVNSSKRLSLDSAVNQMVNALQTSTASGFRSKHMVYETETHGSVPLPAEIDGLNFIFSEYRIEIESSNPEAALLKTHFQHLSEELHYPFAPPEAIVTYVAYNFMMKKEYDQALACYLLNIENYPKSAFTYITVGDIYRDKKGDSKTAREYYERCLKMNPSAGMAKNRIKSLE